MLIKKAENVTPAVRGNVFGINIPLWQPIERERLATAEGKAGLLQLVQRWCIQMNGDTVQVMLCYSAGAVKLRLANSLSSM
jgi:hypothetical protein